MFEQKFRVCTCHTDGSGVRDGFAAQEFQQFHAVQQNGRRKGRREGSPGGIHVRWPKRRQLEYGAATREREPKDIQNEQHNGPVG